MTPLKLAYFDNEFMAVFNCSPYEQRKARAAILAKYGRRGWNIIKARKRTGLMEIFQHAPTKETRLYARILAKHADARVAKYKQNPI